MVLGALFHHALEAVCVCVRDKDIQEVITLVWLVSFQRFYVFLKAQSEFVQMTH